MMRRLVGAVAAAGTAVLFSVSPGLAAGGYTLSGDATLVPGHNSPTGVQLRSAGAGYGAITFAVPAGTTFADIQTLAADYMITAGDCGGGSPRFSIETASGNAFVYFGPAPNYTGCTTGSWQSSGNLAASGFVDTSQLGGTFYDTWQSADAAFGSLQVTAIDLVVDAGWKFGTQTVVFDNVDINGTIYTFESAATCKDSGWQAYGGTFKNQGDCVSFFATGGKNAPAG
jgi:hypothetical protein